MVSQKGFKACSELRRRFLSARPHTVLPVGVIRALVWATSQNKGPFYNAPSLIGTNVLGTKNRIFFAVVLKYSGMPFYQCTPSSVEIHIRSDHHVVVDYVNTLKTVMRAGVAVLACSSQ